ncbi:MAG TPA: hypothetical protein VGU45_16235 [Microvirga sp.]|jgi:hypothetical protein|nr:hypothetical protein [Microvirga sp.]
MISVFERFPDWWPFVFIGTGLVASAFWLVFWLWAAWSVLAWLVT